MTTKEKILSYIKNPLLIILFLGFRGFFHWIPDALWLKIVFRIKMGYKLDLDNPKTFNEKLQWLKLYDRNPLYTTLVDKYEVRKYITETIGEEYLIPLLGYRGIFHWIPDALWLKIVFRIKVRRIILIYSFDFKERINRCNNLCYNIIWSL